MKKEKNYIARTGLIVLLILIVYYIYSTYFYSFCGQVIDADTKEHIKGAVVVASWLEEKCLLN